MSCASWLAACVPCCESVANSKSICKFVQCVFFPEGRVFVFFCSIESCTEGHTEKPNQISQTISVPEEKVWTGDCFAR